ncbi:unnamed protein product, partial [Meganyctiphanes norvegica]
DIDFDIFQNITDKFDETLNFEPPFFLRTNESILYKVMFNVSGPINVIFKYNQSYGVPEIMPTRTEVHNITFELINEGAVMHDLYYNEIIPSPGNMTLEVSVESLLNPKLDPVIRRVHLIVENHIVPNWTIVPVIKSHMMDNWTAETTSQSYLIPNE